MFPKLNGSVGFVQAGLHETSRLLAGWRRTHAWFVSQPDKLDIRTVNGSLHDGMAGLLPLRTPRTRELLWACSNEDWTAYFDNGTSSDALTAIGGLCAQTRLKGVVLTLGASVDPSRKGVQMVLYEGAQTVRYVVLTWEGRWKFMTYGQPLPFEDVDRYATRAKKDRFTEEMLRSYSESLGIRAWNDDFYSDNGVLLSDLRATASAR